MDNWTCVFLDGVKNVTMGRASKAILGVVFVFVCRCKHVMSTMQHVSSDINLNFVPRVESHIWRKILHRPMSQNFAFCRARQISEQLMMEQRTSLK